MKKKKKGYGVLLILTLMMTISGLVTLIPDSEASKDCMIGYKAHCTFTPISTVLCLLFAGLICVRRSKGFTDEVKG